MFRPDPELTLFGAVPVRLIVSIILVFAIVISIILILGIEREKILVSALTSERVAPQSSPFTFLRTQGDIVEIAVILFLLTAVGVSTIATYHTYQGTRKALESVKSLTRNILGSIPTGVITIDSGGRVTSANRSAQETLLLGDGLLGSRILDFVSEGTELGRLIKDGIAGGQSIYDRNVSYRAGDQTFILRVSLSELTNEKGKREGSVLLLKDVSELIRLGQQLRRSEKLSAINTLSAAVAHEIRNPLSAMDLNLGLLEEELLSGVDSAPGVRGYVDVLNVEIKRLTKILDSFAQFSRPADLNFSEVRLDSILQHLVSLVRGEADEKKISIQTDFPLPTPILRADETQIMQVFLNIIINAIQAMPEGGKIQIRVRNRTSAGREWVDVSFADSGVGIGEEKMEKIFEPFFSTRKGGTGLGLAIAHRIIEDHGGLIHVESRVGEGTTFTVQLPAAVEREVSRI